jgi:beta-mannosidase
MAYLAHFNRNPNENVLTRKIIPEVLFSYDPIRPFIPSSPYVDQATYEEGSVLSEDHLWGPRDYYKGDYYKNNQAVFASEIGYHGCPSPESIEKFIPAQSLFPYMNDDWIVHAASPEKGLNGDFSYRIELMANQIKVLFGSIPDDIRNYSLASQISQAEAMKYFIELFRIRKWEKTGIIWWNIMDAWPQFSDAIVDYYFTKKLAYQFIKNVQAPVCMIMDAADDVLKLYGSNDTKEEANAAYEVFVVRARSLEKINAGQCTLKPDRTEHICNVEIRQERNLYFIKWQLKDGSYYCNHYLAGDPPFDFENLVDQYDYAGLLKMDGFTL